MTSVLNINNHICIYKFVIFICNKGPREYIKGLVPFHRSILGGRVIFIKSSTYSYEEVIFFKKKSWEIIKNTAIFFTSISIHPCLRFSFLCRKINIYNEDYACATLLPPLFPTAQAAPDPVLDTDIKKLQSGVNYYTLPVIRGRE
ncbi:unnamed protein product, partial [Vitis vinifera]